MAMDQLNAAYTLAEDTLHGVLPDSPKRRDDVMAGFDAGAVLRPLAFSINLIKAVQHNA
jgi:hypothetical protein